jgi:hypothetical protein
VPKVLETFLLKTEMDLPMVRHEHTLKINMGLLNPDGPAPRVQRTWDMGNMNQRKTFSAKMWSLNRSKILDKDTADESGSVASRKKRRRHRKRRNKTGEESTVKKGVVGVDAPRPSIVKTLVESPSRQSTGPKANPWKGLLSVYYKGVSEQSEEANSEKSKNINGLGNYWKQNIGGLKKTSRMKTSLSRSSLMSSARSSARSHSFRIPKSHQKKTKEAGDGLKGEDKLMANAMQNFMRGRKNSPVFNTGLDFFKNIPQTPCSRERGSESSLPISSHRQGTNSVIVPSNGSKSGFCEQKKSPFNSSRKIENSCVDRVNTSGPSRSKFDHDSSGTLFFPQPIDNKKIDSVMQNYDPEEPSSTESLDLMDLPRHLPLTHAQRFLKRDPSLPKPISDRKPKKISDEIGQVAEYHRKYQEALDFVLHGFLDFNKDVTLENEFIDLWAKAAYDDMLYKAKPENLTNTKKYIVKKKLRKLFGENYQEVLWRLEKLVNPLTGCDTTFRRLIKKINFTREPSGTMF